MTNGGGFHEANKINIIMLQYTVYFLLDHPAKALYCKLYITFYHFGTYS